MPKGKALLAHLFVGAAMNNRARSKRPRIDDGEHFAEEERKHHVLLEQLYRDTREGQRSVLRPGADLDALKKAVSLSLREKYGLRDESVDEEQGSSRVSEEFDAPPKVPRQLKTRKGPKRKWESTHSKQGNADSGDSSSSTDSDPGGDSSSSSTDSDADSDSSSSSTDSRSDSDSSSTSKRNSPDEDSVVSSDNDDPKTRNGSDDSVPKCIDLANDSSNSISTDSASLLGSLESQTQDRPEQVAQCENIQDIPVVGGTQVGCTEDKGDDASTETHPDINDEDEDDYGSDLDEDEEERLVKQIYLHRVRVSMDNSIEDERPEDSLETETPEEADEELTEIRYKGRKYRVGKTYYRVFRGERYMYGLLEMYQQPDGSMYAVAAQVIKHSDTFLSSIEFPRHDYVRLKGVEKVTIDQSFGREVVELDGIPQMVYEVNRGKRLHFAFYPPPSANEQRLPPTSQATVLDLFSGAGGMNLGFHAAGFKTAMAVENNPFAVQTLSEHVNRIFPGDIKSFLSACRQESYRSQMGEVHYIHASPSCQGYSAANRCGGCNDIANNELSLLLPEFVNILKAMIATYEMVTGILREKHRWYLEKIIHDLVADGYKVRCCILNASDYGDPQNRKRLFLFAAAPGIELPRIPPPTHGESRHLYRRRTVRDAIGDLPQPASPDTSEMFHNGALLYNTWHSQTSLSPGDANVVVLNPDEPALTIRGGSTPPLHYQPEQDNQDEPKYRCITLREMAMLQSFPKDFKFWGSKREQRKQVGNAVPVKLATAVARSVHNALTFVK